MIAQVTIRLPIELRRRVKSIVPGEERIYSHEEVWAEIQALEAQGARSL